MSSTLIIGHRGASAIAPENTMAAFDKAFADAADGIEFDVRLARDGEPIVIHDETLRRTAQRRGKVHDFTASDLSRTDVGSWFNDKHPEHARTEYARQTVPTLAHVLQRFADSKYILYVEMKCRAGEERRLAAEVVRVVQKHEAHSRVWVASFALDAISEVKRLDDKIRTAALFEPKIARLDPSPDELIVTAIARGAEALMLHHKLATRRTTELAHARNLETIVWTIDNQAWAELAVDYNLRAVIANNPAQMRRYFDEASKD